MYFKTHLCSPGQSQSFSLSLLPGLPADSPHGINFAGTSPPGEGQVASTGGHFPGFSDKQRKG